MSDTELIYDPSYIVILDEGEGPSIFPSGCAELHEARNPFNTLSVVHHTGEMTPKYSTLPCKPSNNETYSLSGKNDPTRVLEVKGRRVSEGDLGIVEPEEESDQTETSSTHSKTLLIEIIPYQTKLNPELSKYFDKLIHFKGIDESWLSKHKVNLKAQKSPRKTLILDLDGTLICNVSRSKYQAGDPNQTQNPVTVLQNGDDDRTNVISFLVRPYGEKFLKTLRLYYELIVFTASKEQYAKSIIEYLDPKRCCIEYLLHRDQCLMTKDWTIKDLRVIGRRNMKDMIIVDNSVISFSGNMDNGIYIPTYQGDCEDCELLRIMNFLKRIANVDDVRPYIKEFSGIRSLLEQYNSNNCDNL